MKENKSICEFQIMVMYSEVLQQAIDQHNKFNQTDFKIIEIIDDEVIFCKVSAEKYSNADIFNLGHRLAVIEQKLKSEGKIDW